MYQRNSFIQHVADVVSFDKSKIVSTKDGRKCIIHTDLVESYTKEPLMRCDRKMEKKCHKTFITFFTPNQEKVCEEFFEKKCTIIFNKKRVGKSIRKCVRPKQKICDGNGPEECRTVFETSCFTQYEKEGNNDLVSSTKCEKVPFDVCGRGCVVKDGDEKCVDEELDTLTDIPEESCDIHPMKSCKLVTKLVPSLKPQEECVEVPNEICNLEFSSPKKILVPLKTEWCLDEI